MASSSTTVERARQRLDQTYNRAQQLSQESQQSMGNWQQYPQQTVSQIQAALQEFRTAHEQFNRAITSLDQVLRNQVEMVSHLGSSATQFPQIARLLGEHAEATREAIDAVTNGGAGQQK